MVSQAVSDYMKTSEKRKNTNLWQLWSHRIHLHQSGFMDAIIKLCSCEWFWRPSDARGAITRQHLLSIYGQKLSNVCSGCKNVRSGIMIRQGGHKLTDTTQLASNTLSLTYWTSETQTLVKAVVFFFKENFFLCFIHHLDTKQPANYFALRFNSENNKTSTANLLPTEFVPCCPSFNCSTVTVKLA